jgi:hypothetical protein
LACDGGSCRSRSLGGSASTSTDTGRRRSLYDLVADPFRLTNLATSAEHADILSRSRGDERIGPPDPALAVRQSEPEGSHANLNHRDRHRFGHRCQRDRRTSDTASGRRMLDDESTGDQRVTALVMVVGDRAGQLRETGT